MSPSTWFRAVGLCGVLLVLLGLLSWRLAAADVESDSDVDLTLSEGGTEFTNTVGMKFVRIPAAKFMMGAPNDEQSAANNEKPRHQVEITKDFYLGVYEVTQKQYKAVIGSNPSHFSKDGPGKAAVQGMETDDFPVDNVSWNDAQAYLKKLNVLAAEKHTGRLYRLPTEAEWEYACRGGTDVKEPFSLKKPSASLSSKQANFNGNAPYGGAAQGPYLQRTCKVGSYEPNPFGLYDMHGNILEWCEDWYGDTTYSEKDRKDPQGPKQGIYRMLKGGSWNYDAQYCRSAYRNYSSVDYRSTISGFRVACVVRRE
jgi:formylglycine-generating enzyme required for sulfatase activity